MCGGAPSAVRFPLYAFTSNARGSFMINVECIWFAYLVWLWKDFAFFCQYYTQVFPVYQCYTT